MKSSPLRKSPPVHLQLLGNGSNEPFIGVHAVPGRLPELLRYPGESARAFCHRVLHQVSGSGALMAMLMYASDFNTKTKGPSQGTPTTSGTRVLSGALLH